MVEFVRSGETSVVVKSGCLDVTIQCGSSYCFEFASVLFLDFLSASTSAFCLLLLLFMPLLLFIIFIIVFYPCNISFIFPYVIFFYSLTIYFLMSSYNAINHNLNSLQLSPSLVINTLFLFLHFPTNVFQYVLIVFINRFKLFIKALLFYPA